MGVDQDSGVRVLEDPLTNKGHRVLRGRTLRAGLAWPAAGGSETLEQQVHRRYQTYQEQPTWRAPSRRRR